MTTDTNGSAQRWEELKTPEAVMAAFKAGRMVECSSHNGMWTTPVGAAKFNAHYAFAAGLRYRALIEDAPPIPEGFKAWAGGECPEDARGRKTHVILRNRETRVFEDANIWRWWHKKFGERNFEYDIIAYRVEQPERQGEAAEAWVLELLTNIKRSAIRGRNAAGMPDSKLASNFVAICDHIENLADQALSSSPQPIPVESLGRDADDGVEALDEQVAELAKRAADLGTVTDPISAYHAGMRLAEDIRSLASRPAYEWKEPVSGEWLPINREPRQWERELGIEWRIARSKSDAALRPKVDEAMVERALNKWFADGCSDLKIVDYKNSHSENARTMPDRMRAALTAALNPTAPENKS